MTRSAAITYDGLPISSGGAHKLRTRGFVEGFNSLQSFANHISLQPKPTNLTVEIVVGPDVPGDFADPLISDFTDQFGSWRTRGMGEYVGHQWDLNNTSFDLVIERLESERPIPTAGYAGLAAILHSTWDLELLDPKTRQALPFQNKEYYLGFDTSFQMFLGESLLYARISERTTASLFLSLPFEEISRDAKDLVSEIQKLFPARISSKHWKQWSITKKRNGYVGRKIEGLI